MNTLEEADYSGFVGRAGIGEQRMYGRGGVEGLRGAFFREEKGWC